MLIRPLPLVMTANAAFHRGESSMRVDAFALQVGDPKDESLIEPGILWPMAIATLIFGGLLGARSYLERTYQRDKRVILSILADGYERRFLEIREQSRGMSFSRIHTTLDRMEREGLIQSRKVDLRGGRPYWLYRLASSPRRGER